MWLYTTVKIVHSSEEIPNPQGIPTVFKALVLTALGGAMQKRFLNQQLHIAIDWGLWSWACSLEWHLYMWASPSYGEQSRDGEPSAL